MSASTDEFKFSLKVMINKEETKVLFAEVDRDFADIVLSFLTLPMGTIVKLLKKHYGDEAPLVGNLSNVYNSVQNLDTSNFWTEAGKLMLLNPRNSFEAECRKLKLNLDDTEPAKYYTCQDCHYSIYSNVTMYYDTDICECGGKMNREIDQERESNTKAADSDRVFTIKTSSFLITDDLRMAPMSTGSIMQTLSNLGITDADVPEQRILTVGLIEIMNLLKGLLLSRTPLTDLVLQRKDSVSDSDSKAVKCEQFTNYKIEKEETSSNSDKTMSLKVTMQKSTNRVLFAHADEDFIDFLFSFLTIPLGGVGYLLGGNTSLKNIDNLYRSVANLDKYLKDHGTENSILNPEIPPMFLSENQIFALTEQKSPALYYYRNSLLGVEHLSSKKMYNKSKRVCFLDPKGRGSYVMGDGVYMVGDDLTVEPLCMSSTLSVLKAMNIKLSDVKEVDVEIGVKEGLSILKASLSSTSALTTGLGHLLLKEPKKETLV